MAKTVVKRRARKRAEVTDEPYAEARQLVLAYPGPSRVELLGGDALSREYDPQTWQLSKDGTVPPSILRSRGFVQGDGPDCFHVTIPDHFGPPKPDKPAGRLALTARIAWYMGDEPDDDDEPVLALECVDLVDRGVQPLPGAWWTSFGIELHERGFRYDSDGGGTLPWRVELTMMPGEVSAPVGVRVHDGAGWVLFEGPVLLSPSWLSRARCNPVGLLVVAGPVSGSQFPRQFDAEVIERMLGTADLIAARMLVDLHGPTPAAAAREAEVTAHMADQKVSREVAEKAYVQQLQEELATDPWDGLIGPAWDDPDEPDYDDDEYACGECGADNRPGSYDFCDC